MPDGNNPFVNTHTLDEALLDVAALIELSPRDRQVANNRYRRLKDHLGRSTSLLAPYLTDGASLIYAQGSIAISTTIVNGTDDDRFDVDAVVEMDVPLHWSDAAVLDNLEESLHAFPGVDAIERCTRCVQLQFPFMHMDVTILDPRKGLGIERAGQIFHSPDKGPAYRVDSNPWGFTKWFRGQVGVGNGDRLKFSEQLTQHRAAASKNRLQYLDVGERMLLERAEQHPLPPMIPAALDAQEAIALKLLKRYLNLRYEGSSLPRPPSIYLTKRAGDVGYVSAGLSAQLYHLANSTANIMRDHAARGTRPQETNPSYKLDRINDRWPRGGANEKADMVGLADSLDYLAKHLKAMAGAELEDISRAIDELFGERIGKEQRAIFKRRYDRRAGAGPVYAQPRTGAIFAPSIITTPEHMREVPRHNFHPMVLGGKNDG